MKYISDQKINLLRQNARSVVRELGLLNDAYFEVGVTLAERHLLIELASSDQSLTAKGIAERLLLDKSTVSRLVARAIKKGYIAYSIDQNDKRKRYLQMTDLGKTTLSAFEPIAFHQTQNALQTLNCEEINLVYQGVALYAQGLKNSRLQNRTSTPIKKVIEGLEDLRHQLHQLGYTLAPYQLKDEQGLFAIFKEVVDSGCQFYYENNSKEEFRSQFLSDNAQIYVCRCQEGQILGGFYLKPNYSGRSAHIANAAYMVKSSHRGLGIGSLLTKTSLHMAKNLGFQAMQFNMVLSQNTRAIKLYQRLGFEVIGTLPKAIRNPDGTFQDAHSMWCSLENL